MAGGIKTLQPGCGEAVGLRECGGLNRRFSKPLADTLAKRLEERSGWESDDLDWIVAVHSECSPNYENILSIGLPPSTILMGRPSGLMFSCEGSMPSALQMVENRSWTVTGS